MKKVAVLCMLAYVICGGVADAATYYVSKAGRDTDPGSEALPFLSINRGVSVLRAGDTLLVRGGTYAEVLNSPPIAGTSWTSKIRIAAYPGETVWMTPLSGPYVVYFAAMQQYIELDGINLDSRRTGRAAIRIEAWLGGNPHHIRFKNAEVVGGPNGITEGLNGPTAISATASTPGLIGGNEFIGLRIHGGGDAGDMYYGFYINSSDNLIDGCDISDVSGAGIHIYSAYGTTSNNNTIRNSRIHDINRSMDTRTYGIVLASGLGNKVYNNIVYNIQSPDAFGIRAYSSNHAIYNNTVYNVRLYGIQILASAVGTLVTNNVAYGNGTNYNNAGIATIASTNSFDGGDPQFVNASAGDFRVPSTSRLQDAGTALALVSIDFAGTPRPQGAAYDIGAYENPGAQAVVPPAPPTGVRVVSQN